MRNYLELDVIRSEMGWFIDVYWKYIVYLRCTWYKKVEKNYCVEKIANISELRGRNLGELDLRICKCNRSMNMKGRNEHVLAKSYVHLPQVSQSLCIFEYFE